ncbi:MAG: hypothetical protein AAF401_16040 [Pseudomonadota bacterium]
MGLSFIAKARRAALVAALSHPRITRNALLALYYPTALYRKTAEILFGAMGDGTGSACLAAWMAARATMGKWRRSLK